MGSEYPAPPRERGSYTLEGLVATGVFFVLLTLVVQIGFLVLARSAAATSLEASLRRAVVLGLDDATMRERIERDVAAVVPGVRNLVVEVESSDTVVVAAVRFRWVPPGPDFVPVTVVIERSAATVVPP